MILIREPMTVFDAALPEVAVRVDRITIAKRLWRGAAEDGRELGFELAVPLKEGDVVYQSREACYVVRQAPENVLEVSLDMPASAAAGIGWAVGNLHLELQAETNRLLALDEPAARQLLERLKVPYRPTTAIFRPGRFVRGSLTTHELGPSHQH